MDDFFFLLWGITLTLLAGTCAAALFYCLANLILILFFPSYSPRKEKNNHYFNCDLAEEADKYVRSLPIHDQH